MSFIGKFFLLVMFFSFAELYLLIEVASRFSVLLTVALCALTGIVGGSMVRAQGLRTLAEIQKSTKEGRIPGDQIVAGLILLIIGTLLLTPGFITDTIAFAMLIPPLRLAFSRFLVNYFKDKVTVATFQNGGMGMSMGSMGGGNPFQGGPQGPGPGTQRRDPNDVIIEVDAERP